MSFFNPCHGCTEYATCEHNGQCEQMSRALPPPEPQGACERSSLATALSVRSGALVRRVAYAIALAYVGGWRQHAKIIGEPEGMPAEKWADANWEMFLQEAEIATAGNDSEPNVKDEPRGANHH